MKGLIMASLLALTAGMFGCASGKEHKEKDVDLVVTSVIKMDTLSTKEYVCQIRSESHIEMRALETGYLEGIYVDEGQHVKKGQLMFQIMPMLYNAEASKAAAEAEFAKIEYQNTKSLADKNVVSENELALAKAKYDKALAELKLANVHLGFTEVRAPFDGIMDRFHVRLGSLVEEGELLTSLSDNSRMWVYFNVPEAEYLDYMEARKKSDATEVKLMMANNKLFKNPGYVETIEADFNNETGNIAFRATFENPNGLLRHGETGNILMEIPLKDALVIPQKATYEVLDKKYVFVVDANGVAHSRRIKVSTELEDIYVVSGGLKEGDKIIVEGIRKVQNNQKVHFKYVKPRAVLSSLKLFAE